MSEQKKPQAGEYWIHNSSGDKAYFIGECPAGIMVWQCEGDSIEHGNLDWSEWHHEPRCTGWDWQPEPEPEWFDLTPFGEHVLRSCDEAFLPSLGQWLSVYMANAVGASISEMRRVGYTQFRCLLKDAPPELVAMANRPAEDPDEWVTQDRVSERGGVDEYRFMDQCNNAKSEWKPCIVSTNTKHGMSFPKGFIELRCRRRDLPPMREQKPKTEREVLLYWYDGNVVGRYADCPPADPSFVLLIIRDGKVFVETETREVVR